MYRPPLSQLNLRTLSVFQTVYTSGGGGGGGEGRGEQKALSAKVKLRCNSRSTPRFLSACSLPLSHSRITLYSRKIRNIIKIYLRLRAVPLGLKTS